MERLPSPNVELARDFLRRVEAFAPRLAAARERREGAGGAHLEGAGLEFVGRRPYRPGDDPRLIDWELLARQDRPWVRVLHREAQERWAIVVDDSGSMGVGVPGKLQCAAEIAVAAAAVALRSGARVTVRTTSGAGVELRRTGDLARLVAMLVRQRADARNAGLAGARSRRIVPAEAGRVIVLGDLLDVSPSEAFAHARPGRELLFGQVLAPFELDPSRLGLAAARFADPEGEGSIAVRLDPATLDAYRARMEHSVEALAAAAARRGLRHHVCRAGVPFESHARALLEA